MALFLSGVNKMDPNAITSLISNLGFPIAVACALFWKMNKQDEDHKQEMQKLTEALNNNTLAITQLKDSLEGQKKND